MGNTSNRTDRLESAVTPDQREAFQRDRDRILYTQAFRRLNGVTQVARAEESYTFHDRLSHSLKVAQIGRRLAEFLPKVDSTTLKNGTEIHPDVVETAALAHDIGHPPFGHVAESELDQLIKTEKGEEDGFEGNAQSFRIVVNLAPHNDTDGGLNLTMASLNAILKYPWTRGVEGKGENKWGIDEHKKWGAYETERSAYEEARVLEDVKNRRSAEACIMDWSDDLAYAVHDMEDFYKAGILPLEQLLTEDAPERQEFLEEAESKKGITHSNASDILSFLKEQGGRSLLSPFKGSRKERRDLDYFSSTLIERYIGFEDGGVHLQDTDKSEPYLQINSDLQEEVSLLKFMTEYYVIDNPSLRAQQRGQREIVRTLFNILYDAVNPEHNEDRDIIPNPFLDDALSINPGDTQQICRTTADIFTSMTEKQAGRMYKRLTGISTGSITEEIIL